MITKNSTADMPHRAAFGHRLASSLASSAVCASGFVCVGDGGEPGGIPPLRAGRAGGRQKADNGSRFRSRLQEIRGAGCYYRSVTTGDNNAASIPRQRVSLGQQQRAQVATEAKL